MQETIAIVVWLILVIPIHELGHYITYRLFGIIPKVEIKWWGVAIGSPEDYFILTPSQASSIALGGILPGLFFTTIVMTDFWVLIYLLMSVMDIYIMIIAVQYWKRKKAINEIVLEDLLVAKSKYLQNKK